MFLLALCFVHQPNLHPGHTTQFLIFCHSSYFCGRFCILSLVSSFKVCKDIDECEGTNNGGCVANSVCLNTPVSMKTIPNK